MKRPAIICENPESLTETFVRRHIYKLNGGNTFVIGEADPKRLRHEMLGVDYRALLAQKMGIRRALRLLHRFGINDRKVRSIWRLMVGQNESIAQSDYILFEFGYLLARHYDFALYSNKPYFVYFRGKDASSLLKQSNYVETLARLMPTASGAIFVADSLRRNLVEKGIVLPSSAVIPSGVETKYFTPKPKKPLTALSVGRFVEKKAHDDTLRALRIIVDQFPDFHLTLAGNGPLFDNIKQRAHQLNLENNVTFTGVLDREKVMKEMGCAKYYIQSSKTGMDGDAEGFPSAIQEALSSGCVVCSTAHSGAADFLSNHENALICAEGDYEEMANNILVVEACPEISNQLAKKGRAFAEAELDATICIARFEDFVEDCLKEISV